MFRAFPEVLAEVEACVEEYRNILKRVSKPGRRHGAAERVRVCACLASESGAEVLAAAARASLHSWHPRIALVEIPGRCAAPPVPRGEEGTVGHFGSLLLGCAPRL